MHFPNEFNSLDALLEKNYSRALGAFYQAAIESNLPVALWQYPNSQQQQALVDFSGAAHPTRIDFTHQRTGFAFSPFVNEGGQETLFIKADLHLDRAGHHLCPSHRNNGNGNQQADYKQIQFLAAYEALAHSAPSAGQAHSVPSAGQARSKQGPGGSWLIAPSQVQTEALGAEATPFDPSALRPFDPSALRPFDPPTSLKTGCAQDRLRSGQAARRACPAEGVEGTGCAQDRFCALVTDAIAYIQSTGIKKVVASRAAEALLPPDFNPVATFEALCRRYPHAFVSLVSIPNVGAWIGASPELLLSLSNERLRTVALAGTQAFQPDIPLADVIWGAKEIEEQALVSDYIREFFQQLGLSRFAEEGPRTVSAGNVLHLQSDFRVEQESSQLLELANQVLHSLHPTSAVCGMPKKEALSFILEKERYNRAFYSGFLGPVHLNGQSNLFVNLRCMQIKAQSAILYVGAGITRDSIPRAEWEETILKSRTLLSVLESTFA